LKKFCIICICIVLAILAIPTNAPVYAAGSSAQDDETVIGPINVIPVVDIQRLSYDQSANISALKPGGYIGQAVFQIRNLTTDSIFINQWCWAEAPQDSFFPLRIEYTVEGGKMVENYGSLFRIEGKMVMKLTIKVYASISAQPVEGVRLHIKNPSLTDPPPID
jgi:hypothetical protein